MHPNLLLCSHLSNRAQWINRARIGRACGCHDCQNLLAVEAEGCTVETVEGLQPGVDVLHPLQDAFMRHGASQCGFCTPGILMMAKKLLDDNPRPTDEDIRFGLSGNICRCTGYTKIFDAIKSAALEMEAARS